MTTEQLNTSHDNLRRLTIPVQPVPKQKPAERVHNWDEAFLGYSLETAIIEAERCIHCPMVLGCSPGPRCKRKPPQDSSSASVGNAANPQYPRPNKQLSNCQLHSEVGQNEASLYSRSQASRSVCSSSIER